MGVKCERICNSFQEIERKRAEEEEEARRKAEEEEEKARAEAEEMARIKAQEEEEEEARRKAEEEQAEERARQKALAEEAAAKVKAKEEEERKKKEEAEAEEKRKKEEEEEEEQRAKAAAAAAEEEERSKAAAAAAASSDEKKPAGLRRAPMSTEKYGKRMPMSKQERLSISNCLRVDLICISCDSFRVHAVPLDRNSWMTISQISKFGADRDTWKQISASSVEKSGKRVPMTRTASSSSLTSLSAEKTLKSKLLTGITSFLPSKPKVMN